MKIPFASPAPKQHLAPKPELGQTQQPQIEQPQIGQPQTEQPQIGQPQIAESQSDSSRRMFWFGMLPAISAGAFVRLLPVLSAGFPILDGGLFFVMAEEVRRAGYVLPVETSYNASHIPFAYPPLGFYAAALVADITGASMIDVVRVLPACICALSIFAFAILSRLLLDDAPLPIFGRNTARNAATGAENAVPGERWLQPMLASIAFALLPRSFTWMIMGGGLTRAPGMLFLLLSLGQAYLLWTRRRTVFLFSAIACASLTILSHAEMTWTLIYSAAIFWLFYGRSFKSMATALGVAAGAAGATFFWWGTIVARHGLAPFRAAAQTGGHGWYSWSFDLASEPLFPLLTVVGLVGFVVCLREKRFLPPFWMIAMFVIQPRSARTVATIPLALMIGVALDRVVFPFAARTAKTIREHLAQRASQSASQRAPQSVQPAPSRIFEGRNTSDRTLNPAYLDSRAALVTALFLFAYALFSAWIASVLMGFLVLTPGRRAAMAWSARNTPPDSRFLVLPIAPEWMSDRNSEWFPALAQRASVATVQGSEWLPKRRFQQMWRESEVLNSRDSSRFSRAGQLLGENHAPIANVAGMPRDLPGVEWWARRAKADFSYIYIPTTSVSPRSQNDAAPWKATEQALRASPHYRLVYDGEGAVIFQRRNR